MKFLWLDINCSYSHTSLALPTLHAQLSSNIINNSEWCSVRGTTKSNTTQIISEVLEHSPDYIFATAWLFNTEYLQIVLSKICAINSNVTVFLGGPEFLGNNSEFLYNNRYISGVFKGEGEEAFEPFISALIHKKGSIEWAQWQNIEGFEYLDKQGNFHSSEAVTVKEFKTLAIPESSEFFNWEKPFIQLETSRGCFNSCKFCVSGIDKSPIQDLPVEALRARLQTVVDKGVKEVRVLDRTFNGNSGRAIALLDLFREFLGKIQFHIEVHPALLSPIFKRYLEDIPENLLHVEAGIQSLSPEIIANCARKGTPKEALEGVKYLLSLNKFEVHADLIAGLPKYSLNGLIIDTLTLMNTGVQEIQIELLKLLPGTWFRNNAKEQGVKFSKLPPYEILETEAITYKELCKSMVLSKVIDWWYNDARWRESFTLVFKDSYELIEKFMGELYNSEYLSQPLSFESKSMLLYNFVKEHAPEQLFNISLQWIRNGLSAKKEPGNILKSWNIRESSLENPIYEEEAVRVKYYYALNGGEIHWFAFNTEVDRNKPIQEYIVTSC